MATTPTIVVGRNNWGIKNGNLLGYYQSDDGFFVKREFAATRGGGTNGTFVGSNGLIQTAASGNLPRIDFYGGSPALLVEPAATNLALQSQTFDVSGTWTFVIAGTGANPVVTPNVGISPDGIQSADNIVLNVGSGTLVSDASIIKQNITVSAVAYTYSIWLKSNTGANQFVSLRFNSSPSQEVTVTNEWQRFTFTGTPVSGSRDFGLDLRGNNTSGQKTCDILAWGAQLETSSVATSYIPTTTGSVTRNADVINLTGATDYVGQTEGTMYAEVDYRNFANITILSVQTASIASGAVRIENTNNGTQLRCHVRDVSGTAIMDEIITSPLLSTGINKIAVAYSSAAGGLCIALNGAVVFTGTAAAAFTINPDRIYVGSREVGGAAQMFFNNRIRSAAIYNKRLSNQELIEITS
jgi:hypothetical protein